VTIGERLVAEHTGLNFIQIEELPIDTYFLIMRDAFIFKQSQTEAGREYLEKCWIMEQTKPDRKTLRKRFGKTGDVCV